jgi:ribosomal protein L12E/L44/L45/RPP1/RPP2
MNNLEMLAEGLGYEGAYFTENWIFSNLVKAYIRDAKEYGSEVAGDMYITLFGEELQEAIDYIDENYDYITEAVNVDSPLLFEGYLGEKADGKGATSVVAASGKAKGVLKGLWDKLKGLGSGVIGKLKGFVEKGIPWAKEIVEKGASFFASNPIAQIAVPAVAIAGGAAGAAKLINKMRKKAGKGKMSQEEKEKFKKQLQQNQGKIKKYVGSGGQANEEFEFKEKNLDEDVSSVEIMTKSVSEAGAGVKATFEASFATTDKTEEEIRETCKSEDFKKDFREFLSKYF